MLGLKKMIKSVILWAIVAGFLFKHLNVMVPDSLIETIGYIGAGAH